MEGEKNSRVHGDLREHDSRPANDVVSHVPCWGHLWSSASSSKTEELRGLALIPLILRNYKNTILTG